MSVPSVAAPSLPRASGLRPPPVPIPHPCVIAVAVPKGGVGKSTLAYELAAAWDAVLVDLDWDQGGTTRMWGARPNDQLLAALEGGPAPRPRRAAGRPALVAHHPDLAEGGWRPEQVADQLEQWAASWEVPLVADCHPGAGELAYGAMSAAAAVIVPAVLRERELDALAGMVAEFGKSHPLVLVPNQVPPVPPARQLRRLRELATGLHVAPPVSAHPWLGRRSRRSAVVLSPITKRTERAVAELEAVAQFVRDLVEAGRA